MFTKMIIVNSENHTKYINTFCGQLQGSFNIKKRGTYYNI